MERINAWAVASTTRIASGHVNAVEAAGAVMEMAVVEAL